MCGFTTKWAEGSLHGLFLLLSPAGENQFELANVFKYGFASVGSTLFSFALT